MHLFGILCVIIIALIGCTSLKTGKPFNLPPASNDPACGGTACRARIDVDVYNPPLIGCSVAMNDVQDDLERGCPNFECPENCVRETSAAVTIDTAERRCVITGTIQLACVARPSPTPSSN